MNRRFYWEITAFFGKHAFNVRFFILNIHFCISNIHFFFIQKSTYMYYEAHSSRSKADPWETLSYTPLFRECLLVDLYGIIYGINSPWCSNYTRVTDHFQSVTLFSDDHRIPYFLGPKKSCYRFYTDNRILISLFYFSFIFPSIRIISFWACALVTFA